MPDFTTRLNMYLPGGGSSGTIPDEVVDVDKINDNMEKIDEAVGAFPCTSGTRPASPYTGQIIYETDTFRCLVWNGTAWVITDKVLENGYRYLQTVKIDATGTFDKADYPGLRALRVCVIGGGGGGGGAGGGGSGSIAAGGGGSGAYAESFITDIAGLAASVDVTVGAGGAGGAAGNGTAGGESSFGALVVAGGGGGGAGGNRSENNASAGGSGGVPTAGNIQFAGNDASRARAVGFIYSFSDGAPSILGGGKAGGDNAPGGDGAAPGAGGSGASTTTTTSRAGGAGAAGIVLVDIYV